MNNAEKNVSSFYNSIGWKTENNITEDSKRWEDLRDCAAEYNIKTRLRLLDYIPKKGDKILDMASGPIQYSEYLEYSKNFNKRYCVDLSTEALKLAKHKIGNHGVFLNKSFFDLDLKKNMFDCSLSIHTIYHIDKDLQEKAVRKLLKVTKPDHPVIIVYSNPKNIISLIISKFKYIKNLFKNSNAINQNNQKNLYFYNHSIKWWNRFKKEFEVKIYPWRLLSPKVQKKMIPDNIFGKFFLRILFFLEQKQIKISLFFCLYITVVLKKSNNDIEVSEL